MTDTEKLTDEPAAEAEPAASTDVSVAFSVERKIEQIRASAMTEKDKDAYISQLLGADVDPVDAHRVPFVVYANIKGIKNSIRTGMLAYPKAKGVSAATVSEWDQIFSDF